MSGKNLIYLLAILLLLTGCVQQTSFMGTGFDPGDGLNLDGGKNYNCADGDGVKGQAFADFGGCAGVKQCIQARPLFDGSGKFVLPYRPDPANIAGTSPAGTPDVKYTFIELWDGTFVYAGEYDGIRCPAYIKRGVQPDYSKKNDRVMDLTSCSFSPESFETGKIFAGAYAPMGLNPYRQEIASQCVKDQATGRTTCIQPELEPISPDSDIYAEECRNGVLKEHVCDANRGKLHLLKLTCPAGCDGEGRLKGCAKVEPPKAPSPAEVGAGLSDDKLFKVAEGVLNG